MLQHFTSGFEQDVADQPDALDAAASAPLPDALSTLDLGKFDRIVLTGMGSSDYVTIPLELAMARKGLPVWRLQTSRLLETPELITEKTLLWVTSQSGRSAEVVALLQPRPRLAASMVIAVTNDRTSPLGVSADCILDLHSGSEATVSSKSYLNTLSWVRRICALIAGSSDLAARDEVTAAAASLRAAVSYPKGKLDLLIARALNAENPRFALVGVGDDTATALTGALIMKEGSKVCAEGYAGGAFRHGPMELAGPGLTALLFGPGGRDETTLQRLSQDLSRSGSLVVAVGPVPYQGAEHVNVPAGSDFERMAHAMHAVQEFCIGLARAGGLTPGEFRFGNKITAQL